jgi:hypothetical protein
MKLHSRRLRFKRNLSETGASFITLGVCVCNLIENRNVIQYGICVVNYILCGRSSSFVRLALRGETKEGNGNAKLGEQTINTKNRTKELFRMIQKVLHTEYLHGG